MSDASLSSIEVVESPTVFVRVLESEYAQHAGVDFAEYVRTTLWYNQRAGGRFNAPKEFGVLYAASDEETAWAELHRRYTREGLTGLPSFMGLLLIKVSAGSLLDLNRRRVRAAWHVSLKALTADRPTMAQRETCWELGRGAREVVDFLRSPSARASGNSIPIFADRPREGALALSLVAAVMRRPTPKAFRQQSDEQWE